MSRRYLAPSSSVCIMSKDIQQCTNSLQQCSAYPSPPSQCLWKITRQLPQLLPAIKVDHLLREVHFFFHGYTQLVPAPTPNDTPYRTVKTVLFHLTNIIGAEVGCFAVQQLEQPSVSFPASLIPMPAPFSVTQKLSQGLGYKVLCTMPRVER